MFVKQKYILFFLAAVIILTPVLTYYYWWKGSGRDVELRTPITKESNMRITSTAFDNNGNIPSKYTCDGQNINPPLTFHNVPGEAKGLAVVVEDPDAHSGTFVHWLMWDINPAVTVIQENVVPEGAVQGITDFDTPRYGGPCPPSGTHRYFFKLYALDKDIFLEPTAKVRHLERAMAGHIIEKAEFVGLYGRQ